MAKQHFLKCPYILNYLELRARTWGFFLKHVDIFLGIFSAKSENAHRGRFPVLCELTRNDPCVIQLYTIFGGAQVNVSFYAILGLHGAFRNGTPHITENSLYTHTHTYIHTYNFLCRFCVWYRLLPKYSSCVCYRLLLKEALLEWYHLSPTAFGWCVHYGAIIEGTDRFREEISH